MKLAWQRVLVLFLLCFSLLYLKNRDYNFPKSVLRITHTAGEISAAKINILVTDKDETLIAKLFIPWSGEEINLPRAKFSRVEVNLEGFDRSLVQSATIQNDFLTNEGILKGEKIVFDGFVTKPVFNWWYLLANLIIGLILAIILEAMIKVFFSWRQGEISKILVKFPQPKVFLCFFIISIGISFFFLILYWPGVVHSDLIFTWGRIKGGRIDNWLSYPFYLTLICIIQLVNSIGAIGVFYSFLSSFLISLSCWYFWNQNGLKKIIIPIFILYAINIPIVLNNLQYVRDVIFGYLISFLALYFYFKMKKRVSLSKVEQWIVILFSTYITLLRPENLLMIFLLPLVLWFGKLVLSKDLLKFSMKLVVVFIFFHTLFPKITNVFSNSDLNRYSITAKINPIGYMFTHGYYSKNYKKDKAIIEKLIPLEVLKKNYSVEQINWWATSPIAKRSLHGKELKDFNKLYFRMIIQNPHLFLANRVSVWMSSLGSPHTNMLYVDSQGALDGKYREQSVLFKKIIFEYLFDLDLYTAPGKLRSKISKEIKKSLQVHRRYKHWYVYPALILLVLSIILYGYIPRTALVSLLVASRIPILFMAIPASHFKYNYSFHVFSFILILMIFDEVRTRYFPEKESFV